MRGMRRPVAVGLALVALCGLSGAGAAAATPAASAAAFVRVNQLGYPSGEAKRAYLMSATPAAGAAFTVRNAAGRTLSAGQVGGDLGAWSSTFPHVYPIDFHVRAAGTYTIAAAGATSPAFVVGSGRRVYGQALRNARSFYQDERDGPDFIRSPLRTAPAHLNDEHAMTYLTPVVDPNDRQLRRRPDAARHAHRRRRRLVGRRRLPEVRRDDQLHRRDAAGGRARLPPPDRRARPGPRTSAPRRRSGRAGCCTCGTTGREPSTTRSGSARATTRSSATTTSGGSPRPMTTTTRPTPPTATSATGRSSAPVLPARRSAPTWPDATPPPWRWPSRSTKGQIRASRRTACGRRSTSSRWPTPRPMATC